MQEPTPVSVTDTDLEVPELPEPPEQPRPVRGRGLSIAMGLLALRAVGGLLFNSCTQTRTTLNAPAATGTMNPLLSADRKQAIAEEFVRAVSTFGVDVPITDYQASLRPLVGSNSPYLTYPLTGKGFARCLQEQCSSHVLEVTSENPGGGNTFTLTVDTEFTTSTSTSITQTTWTVELTNEGRVINASGSGQN